MSYPHYFIRLNPDERRQMLIKLSQYAVKGQHSQRRRLQAIYFSDKGETFEQISKRLNVSYRTVQRWISFYHRKGLNGF
ncbi:MAG: helix-turn-helix domain-containing protein [Planctomycetota bacterium]